MITVLPRTSPIEVTPRLNRVVLAPRIGTVGLVVHTDHGVFHTAFVVVGDEPTNPSVTVGGLLAETGDQLITESGDSMMVEEIL